MKTERQDHAVKCPEVYRVWIGEEERVASFHKVDGYKLQIIKGRDDYVKYLETLQEQGFRFQ